VQDYLARAHVFALLADTTFHDGLPNVVLEAMASGRPVILSPLPAAGEAVEHGREGFILDAPDDLEGFVAALDKLRQAPEQALRMADAARARVVAEHDAGLQIARLRELFNQRRDGPDT
jgi:glycosyltransferase involved in cell wall biosynthesis